MEDLLNVFVSGCKDIFSDGLAGVYLHGSAAMGCYNPDRSDLDLIVVTYSSPSDDAKRRFMDMAVRLNEQAPAKGIETSVVQACYCEPFVYTTPFELHFSAAHLEWYKRDPDGYIRRMNGTDKDLAAHFTVIRHRGICLFGQPIAEIFGEVRSEYYLDSIICDVADARGNITEDPMYVALNLCRVLAFRNDGLILSKAEGGQWALDRIPAEYRGIVSAALEDYGGEDVNYPSADRLTAFADNMLSRIGT